MLQDFHAKFYGQLVLNEEIPSKAKALWLGPWSHNIDEPLNSTGLRSRLERWDSHYQKQNEGKKIKEKVDKLSTVLVIWQFRSPTLFGRVLITKCLGISQLVYSISILDTPTSSLLFKFIWKKADKTGRKVMSPDYVTEVCVRQTLS